MKIEKVNDNQIRCTLTKDDLASRQLKISELAYGTDKAKSLFRDMMQQANFEFGFEADDIPLMIEAIPMNAECIVLVITKVEDPEELDTRFARFAPSVHEEDDMEDPDSEPTRDEVMDLFRRLQEKGQSAEEAPSLETAESAETAEPEKASILHRLFQFSSLNEVVRLSHRISHNEDGTCTLYKDDKTGRFLLHLTHSSQDADIFNRLCNIASEYGSLKKVLPTTPAYLEEHCSIILPANALEILWNISR